MTCFRPLSGFLVDNYIGLPDKQKLILKPYKTMTAFYAGKRLTNWFPVPCGKCAGCKLDHSQSWSVRLQLEASLYPDELNHFITLTYRDDCNPVTLRKRDVQLFMKRLRSKYSDKIRFFLCGEYGTSTGRPHYHLLLFNAFIDDLEPYSKLNPNGLYTSKFLDSVWKFGNVIIGKVTPKSIGYTSRYVLKKQVKPEDKELFNKVGLAPEFTLMSRKPGIGADAFKKEWFEWNYIPLNGRRYPINRYYIDIFKKFYDYKAIQEWSRKLSDINFLKFDDPESYYNELLNKEILFKHRMDILGRRGLDQYGIN